MRVWVVGVGFGHVLESHQLHIFLKIVSVMCARICLGRVNGAVVSIEAAVYRTRRAESERVSGRVESGVVRGSSTQGGMAITTRR